MNKNTKAWKDCLKEIQEWTCWYNRHAREDRVEVMRIALKIVKYHMPKQSKPRKLRK